MGLESQGTPSGSRLLRIRSHLVYLTSPWKGESVAVDEEKALRLGAQVSQCHLGGKPGMLGLNAEPSGGVIGLSAKHRRRRAPTWKPKRMLLLTWPSHGVLSVPQKLDIDEDKGKTNTNDGEVEDKARSCGGRLRQNRQFLLGSSSLESHPLTTQ